jgi:hypothetical protein
VKSLFGKRLVCSHCKGYFKRKLERGKVKYCCTNYDAGKCDRRVIIEELFLIMCLEKRYNKKLSDDEVGELVDRIVIEDKLLFEIELSDGSDSIIYGEKFIRY